MAKISLELVEGALQLDGPLPLLTSRGAPFTLGAGQAGVAARSIDEGAGIVAYAVVISTATSRGVTYSEQRFGLDGVAVGRAETLDALEVVRLEPAYEADLNGDVSTGFAKIGARKDAGTGDASATAPAVFDVSGGALAILTGDGTDQAHFIPLVTDRGAIWSLRSGQSVAAVVDVDGGFRIVVATESRGTTAYAEHTVSAVGVVETRGTALSTLEVIERETAYGVDINDDSDIGFDEVGARKDRGTTTPPTADDPAVFEVSGGALAILTGDGTDQAHFIPLVTDRGAIWSLRSGQSVAAVDDAAGGGFRIVVATESRGTTTYAEHTVSAAGVVETRGTALSTLEVIERETDYGVDINADGDVGFALDGARMDRGTADPVSAMAPAIHTVLDGGALAILTGDGSQQSHFIPLVTDRGAIWSLRSGQSVAAVDDVAGGGFRIVVATESRGTTTYAEHTVSAAGVVETRGTALSTLEVIERETAYGVDINDDGDGGFDKVDPPRLDRNVLDAEGVDNGKNVGLFEVSQGAYAIVADPTAPEQDDYLPLVTDRGAIWTPTAGVPVALRKDGDAYRIILENADSTFTPFTEYAVSAEGVVASRGTPLTPFQVVALEADGLYDGDVTGGTLSGDPVGTVGFVKTNETRVDRGVGDIAVFEISGFGYAIGILDGAETTLFPLALEDGRAWTPGTRQTPVAIRGRIEDNERPGVLGDPVGVDYFIVSRLVTPTSEAFYEFAVRAGVKPDVRGTLLTAEDVLYREGIYGFDINGDGAITVLAPLELDLKLDPTSTIPLNFNLSTGTIRLDASEFTASDSVVLTGGMEPSGSLTFNDFSGTLDADGVPAGANPEIPAMTGAFTVNTAASAGAVTINAGTGNLTVNAAAAGTTVTVNADSMGSDDTLTLSGAGNVNVDELSSTLAASGHSGTLDVDTEASAGAVSITSGSGATTVTAETGVQVTLNAAALAAALTLDGAGSVTATGVAQNVTATSLSGTLDVTTTDAANITVTTGSGNTTVESAGTVAVVATAMGDEDTLTLQGAGTFTVTDLASDVDADDTPQLTGSLTLTTRDTANIAVTTGSGATTVNAVSGSTVTVNADSMGSDDTLTLSGAGNVNVDELSSTLAASGHSGTLDVDTEASAGAVSITSGSGATTVTAETGVQVTLNATALAAALTLDGAGDVTATNVAQNVTATSLSGAFDVTMTNTVAQTLTTGSGNTTVTANGSAALTVDAVAMASDDDLTLKGTGAVTINNLTAELVGAEHSGALTLTVPDNAAVTASTDSNAITATLGSNAMLALTPGDGNGTTDITANGGAVSVDASSIDSAGEALALSGASAFTVTNIATSRVSYDGSGSLAITPTGTMTLDLEGSAGAVSIDTASLSGGTLTIDNAPVSGLTITGSGAVVIDVDTASTDLSGVAATVALTVNVAGGASTSLTADQATGSTATVAATGSLAITGAVAATTYDFSNIDQTDTGPVTLTYATGGVVGTTQFGGIDTISAADGVTLTLTATQAADKSLTTGAGAKVIFDLATNDDIRAQSMPTIYDLALQSGATNVQMTIAQHANAAAVTGDGTEGIVFTDAGTATGDPDIEGYTLSDAGANTFTVAATAGASSQNVTGGTANDTVVVGASVVAIGAYTLGDGTNTVQLADGADIKGATLTDVDVIALDSDASVTMTVGQHSGESRSITGAGTETVILSDAGTLTASAAIETYTLAAESGTVLTLAADAQSVTGDVGAFDDTVIVGARTLTGDSIIDLGGGTADKVQLQDGANTAAATLSNVETIEIEANASVTMSVDQHTAAGRTVTAGVDATVTFSNDTDSATAAEPITGAATVDSYVLADGTNDFQIGAAAQNVTTQGGSGTIRVGTLAATGTFDIDQGSYTLVASGGADIQGVNGGASTTAAVLEMTGAVTMTLTQHDAFGTVTASGPSDAITLIGAGSVGAKAGVESYTLDGAGANTFTVNASTPGVSVTGGAAADTIVVGGANVGSAVYSLGAGANVVRLGNGANVSQATISAVGGTFAFDVLDGATATMSTNQHIGATAITGAGTNAITFSNGGTITGDADIGTYTLADAVSNTFTLGANGQSVTGGTGADKVVIDNRVLTGSSTIDLDGGSDTIEFRNAVNIAAATVSDVETFDLAANAAVTMTVAQHEAVAFTGLGAVTFSDAIGAGPVTGEATVTRYTLANGANSFILGADGQGVTGGTGADVVDVGARTITGAIALGDGTDTVKVSTGANLSGASTFTGVETIDVAAAGATVTISEAQHAAAITVAGGGAQGGDVTIVFSEAVGDGGSTLTGKTSVARYTLTGTANDFTFGYAGQSVSASAGSGTIRIGAVDASGTFAFTGAADYTLDLTPGANISGVNGGAATTANALTFTGPVSMTAAQHNAFTSGITALSGADTITLTTADTATGDADVETYVLGDGANTFTLGATGQNVTESGGANTLVFGAGAYTGTFTGFDADETYRVVGGTNLSGATGLTQGTLDFQDASATVTLNAAQNGLLTIANAAGAQIIVVTEADTFTADAAIETYRLTGASEITVAAGTNVEVAAGDTADQTVIVNALTTTGSYSLGDGDEDTVAITAISDISASTFTGVERVTLGNGVNATMTIAQNALISTATGANSVGLSEAGVATGAAEVETYNLANGANTFTLGALAQNVNGGTGANTLVFGAGAYTGTFTGFGADDTYRVVNGTNLSGATGLDAGVLDFQDATATVTLDAAQNASLTILADGADSGTQTIALTEAASFTGDAAIEAYILANGNQTFTVGAAGQAVTTGTGDVTISTNVVTGALNGSAGGVVTLAVTGGTLDFTGVTLTGLDAVTIAAGATVTLTAAQVAQIGIGAVTGDGTLRIAADEGGSVLDATGASVAVVLEGGAGADTFVFIDGVEIAGFDATDADKIDVSSFAAPVVASDLEWNLSASSSTGTPTSTLTPTGDDIVANLNQPGYFTFARPNATLTANASVTGNYEFDWTFARSFGTGGSANLGRDGSSNNLLNTFSNGTTSGSATFVIGDTTTDVFRFDFGGYQGQGGFDATLTLSLTAAPDAPIAFGEIQSSQDGADAVLTIGPDFLRLVGTAAVDVQESWFLFS
ncbi:MAG: hypothetical protein ACE37J_21810 [Pikeienuella sp.]|uniref:hypothetical protein n=1 Tax=Pikeienuella sp. TaxID=2831957 RepID=UPI0039195877